MKISELMVIKSAAGWYVGRTCEENGIGGIPYSRESGYYRSKAEAQFQLRYMIEREVDNVN